MVVSFCYYDAYLELMQRLVFQESHHLGHHELLLVGFDYHPHVGIVPHHVMAQEFPPSYDDDLVSLDMLQLLNVLLHEALHYLLLYLDYTCLNNTHNKYSNNV